MGKWYDNSCAQHGEVEGCVCAFGGWVREGKGGRCSSVRCHVADLVSVPDLELSLSESALHAVTGQQQFVSVISWRHAISLQRGCV